MGEIMKVSRAVLTLLVLAASLSVTSTASAAPAGPGTTYPISWLNMEPGTVPGGMSGFMGMGSSSSPTSTDGRYVLFTSTSPNLSPDADPSNINLFRKDMQTGAVVLANRLDGPSGASMPGQIYSYDMSGDGNLVVILSPERLTADDLDDEPDAFLRNIGAGTTKLISTGTAGAVSDVSISADGTYVAVATESALVPGDVNGLEDVYRYRLADGTVDIVSRIPALPNAGDKPSREPSISADGRWVAFTSRASNLIAGFTDNNGDFGTDVFVRDMVGGVTYLISSRFDSNTQSGNGAASEPTIAGKPAAQAEVRVAFTGYGTNLADNGVVDPSTNASIYLKSMPSQASELVSRASGPAGANADSRAHTASISDDATRIVFSSDAGNLGAGSDYYGVYMRDRGDNSTRLVSAKNEYAVWGLISADGTHATWPEAGGGTPDSDPDLNSVFRRSFGSNEIRLVSRPPGNAKVVAPGFNMGSSYETHRTISADNRYIVFSTWSSHLPDSSGFADQVYRRDLKTGETILVSRADGVNGPPALWAGTPALSSDGNRVAFTAAGPLDPSDANDRNDVYVRDIAAGTTTLVSRADGFGGAVSNQGASNPSLSADGNVVAFESDATNMGYPGPHTMVYVRDVQAGSTGLIGRASGEAGAAANGSSGDPLISGDGSKVIYRSSATNLSPDDLIGQQSLYLRDRSTNQTELVSRAPGLAGASITGSIFEFAFSQDGTKVAFATDQSAAVPATAPWPAGTDQVVVRNLADGANVLGSADPGGLVGNENSTDPSLNGDGSILAFGTEATNLRSDIDVTSNKSVAIKNFADGSVSGPPLFGRANTFFKGSDYPEVSQNGDCVLFTGVGGNAVSGNLASFRSGYIYVRSGTCDDPRPSLTAPKLTAVSLKPFKFRVGKKATAKVAAKRKRKKVPAGTKIRFTLSEKATVTFRVDRKLKGRKVGKKCVKPNRKNRKRKACKRLAFRGKLTRMDRAAGKRVVPFSGRIGKRALKPGKYRVVIQAISPAGSSAKVYRSFRIVKK